ncbi:18446_t:CDS:2 [Rhizophagus irregularis]|nr:18446_t:CDS:2 [Rhizophagus irregularis]
MSSEQPLHVVIKIPYKRPPGFVEPPSVVWTEEMEQKLWEILTQNKRQSIDWYAASRLLNVPVPYLLRHAAFLYETQLRGVQMQLRRGETLSASTSTGTIGSRNRASSRASLTKVSIFDGDGVVTGHQRPPSATSNASREQYITSRGGYAGSQDMIRTGSNTSLTDGRKQASGSESSSIHAPITQSINEAGLQVQGKNVFAQGQATPSSNISGRQMSPSSSVSTITTDQVTKQSTHITYKPNYSTTLSTIESSSTNECFATPAASVTIPLSRTLSNPLSLEAHSSNERLEKLEKLQKQDIAAFLLPNSSSSVIQTDVIGANENNEPISFKVPTIDLAVNLQQQPAKGLRMNIPTAAADSQQSLSANDSSSSFSDIDSLTHSELENAYLEEASNFNGSKTSLYSVRKSTYPS